ncbi:hypothetical protein J608_3971, partial [Acinetobacter baumannii 1288284]
MSKFILNVINTFCQASTLAIPYIYWHFLENISIKKYKVKFNPFMPN